MTTTQTTAGAAAAPGAAASRRRWRAARRYMCRARVLFGVWVFYYLLVAREKEKVKNDAGTWQQPIFLLVRAHFPLQGYRDCEDDDDDAGTGSRGGGRGSGGKSKALARRSPQVHVPRSCAFEC